MLREMLGGKPLAHRQIVPRTLFASCLILVSSLPTQVAYGQLGVLSEGDVDQQWRLAQLATLQEQMEDGAQGELKQELSAQIGWLSNWQPGSLKAGPATAERVSVRPEPVIDPDGTAAALRARLLGREARPTVQDTASLKRLLVERPQDVGIRQLHLHWLDQLQYRKEYSEEIAKVADRLLTLLNQVQPQTPEVELAKAFCLYRCGRALAYRELPDVVAKRPLDDPQELDGKLRATYAQLKELTPQVTPEFVLLDIRMLRRDSWFGRALALLEDYAGQIDRKWYLKKRRDLLSELQWTQPSEEAAEIYAREFPEAVAAERKED